MRFIEVNVGLGAARLECAKDLMKMLLSKNANIRMGLTDDAFFFP